MNQGLIKKWKKLVKSKLKELEIGLVRMFFRFKPTDLAFTLTALGIKAGDTVFVHSSFDAFKGFMGKPTDIIQILQGLVGMKGIIMMPTMAFAGTAVEFALQNPVVDIKRVPSRMGLITELFRRFPGVVRSPHPTHPIAVWGEKARDVTANHHLAQTPCGTPSPLEKLLAYDGKIILLGTGFEVLTFYHTVEEILEGKLPVNPFTHRIFSLQVKNENGEILDCHTRLYEPAVSKRRRLNRVMQELRQMNALGEKHVGMLHVQVTSARDVFNAVKRLLDRGINCYE